MQTNKRQNPADCLIEQKRDLLGGNYVKYDSHCRLRRILLRASSAMPEAVCEARGMIDVKIVPFLVVLSLVLSVRTLLARATIWSSSEGESTFVWYEA